MKNKMFMEFRVKPSEMDICQGYSYINGFYGVVSNIVNVIDPKCDIAIIIGHGGVVTYKVGFTETLDDTTQRKIMKAVTDAIGNL